MKANHRPKEEPVRVLYLDLDGTVRKGYDELGRFVNGPEDVEVFEGVPALLAMYKSLGWRIASVSNQGGVALGHLSLEQCSEAMLATYDQCNGLFDKMVFCVHHPDAVDPEMARCWCRKPRAGLVWEAAAALAALYHEYYPPHMALFIGDRDEDRGCAEAANLDFMEAAEWRSGAHLRALTACRSVEG